ncbi:MAG TPA: amidase [Actinophytocola sp.]|uniref:amidase n=1 Tax=Actinophytocola sp. TaxID=1872138 RepID=UPI002DB837DA|nr:amidase [Actinophytocola sp.]HEU5470705.1 amidase [Actinophytocola sp.]
MDLQPIATWVGMEPTAERLDRLAWAAPFLTESSRAIAEVEGIGDDEVPEAAVDERLVVVEAAAAGAVAGTRPAELGVIDAALAIRNGKLAPAELLESCLETIERTDRLLGAFVRLTDDAARAQARLAAGPPTGVLHGIPFAAKDLIDTVNAPTEYGSQAFAGRMPRWDATVITRIRSAGGILVGKTATHEIAYGVSTPQVRNPWDPAKMTSGSSGGSAAALAARQVPMALGTDTGGSLRLPSAFCGTTAIKPTFGLVPRTGVMLLAASFDTVGPMARTAQDCWLLLQVLTGTAPAEPAIVTVDPRRVRIGVADVATPDQHAAADVLRDQGAQLINVTLPSPQISQAAATVLAFAEAATQFRAHVLRDAPFPQDIQSVLEAGLTVPIADFLHAQRVRAAIRRDYAELFGRVDVILLPTSPITDLPHGISEWDGVPLIPLLTPYTLPASLTGLPAIAFPCGFTESGMPIGAQLIGPARSEPLLTAVAHAYQQATDWHTRQPDLP